MAYVLGIDLGTSYSAAAVGYADGRVEMFQLGQRSAAIPSLVVMRADGEVLTGEAAERRAFTEPARTAREFKRRLGDPVPLVIGGTPYGPDALLAILLRSIVGQVAVQLGGAPAHVVVTHPASYGPYKLDLLRAATRQADIADASFVSEPVAAAVHYATLEHVPKGATVAVYDFGGGTFDATILETTAVGFEPKGTPEGLERLGGVDFDEAIFRHVVDAVGGAVSNVDASDPAAQAGFARLREECRRAKEALSADSDAVIPVALPGVQTEVRITRGEFEAMIEPRIAETVSALERAARSAAVQIADIDRILLVGGTSRIPRIAERVRSATGRPVAVDAHPKHSVALGAARIGLAALATRAVAPAGMAPAPILTPTSDAALGAAPGPAVGTSAPGSQPAHVAEPLVRDQAMGTDALPSDRPSRASTARVSATSEKSAAPIRVVAVAAIALLVMAAVILVPRLLGGSGDGAPAGPTGAAGIPTLPPVPSALPTFGGAIPTLPPVPSALPTFGTDPSARITNVTLAGDRYEATFETTGFTPAPGSTHVHFFWDTVPPEEAGAGGAGPYVVYDRGSPFAELGPGAQPRDATALCIIVANPDHSVRQGSGSCAPLP